MSWLEILLISLAILLLYIFSKKPNNYPPGPISLPLIGNILSLSFISHKSPFEKFNILGKTYGPLTGLLLGPKATVIVSGYDAVKHVLSRDDLAFRPDNIPTTSQRFNQRLGVIFTDGNDWKEQRRFTLRHLRDFGFGRRSMEGLIHEEARALVQCLSNKACDQPHFNILPMLPVHSINILWTIMAGKRHEVDDEEFLKLTEAVMKFFSNGDPTSPANTYPILQKLPIIGDTFQRQLEAVHVLQNFLQDTINDHMKDYDENHIRDFIDVYIKEMKIKKDEISSFSTSQLCVLCLDLFIAGTETTSGTLAHALRYMIHYPHIQEKVRAEILREIGSQRLPGMEDLPKLHYVQAILNEVLRHSGLASIAVPHATPGIIEVMGYTLPKDTVLIVNLLSVHMDPKIWGDPENFRPERFICEDGTFRKNEHSFFFGLGPRMCLGEPLARYSMFLIFSALVQNFKFTATPGAAPSDKMIYGITTAPAPYVMTVRRAE